MAAPGSAFDAAAPSTDAGPPPAEVGPAIAPLPPAGDFATEVTVRLQAVFPGAKTIVFGLPVPPGVVTDPAAVRVSAAGRALPAAVGVLLRDFDRGGNPAVVRALRVQLAASVMTGPTLDIDVAWRGGGTAGAAAEVPFSSDEVSAASPEVVHTTQRTIQATGGVNRLVESPAVDRTLFSGREPRVMALLPPGYLAATGVLGEQVAAPVRADLAGLAFFSDSAASFGLSAIYQLPYTVEAAGVVDPVSNYEGWLYDRCATFLTFYTHTGDVRFLRHAFRSCSYYAGQIQLAGPNAGIFKGKPDPDSKYSHLRGLYAYHALTGDGAALAAGQAVAAMWEKDPTFVVPYRMGRLRAPDHLWTERLLGASLEGLVYGARLTGEAHYLQAAREMVDTAYRHITGDASTLAQINPGVGPFAPQNCFIHSAAQHAEGNATDPWCSGWMSELAIDPLLRYQDQTGDERVDEIVVRLTRFLRDVGAQYLVKAPEDDSFLHPRSCAAGRMLIPLYGAGLRADGSRYNAGADDDGEHCADGTLLTAAALRALKRRGWFAANPVAPFAGEGESFVQLHHELAACARRTLQGWTRLNRDPGKWTSAQLAPGLADPARFIADNLIGYPTHPTTPQRKLSWWFNGSLLQLGLLAEAGVTVPALTPGRVQPAGCPPPSAGP
jgi:hypothetical protein